MAPIRTIFMGSDAFSLPVLQALIREGAGLRTPVEVVAVATQPDRPAGRGRRLVEGPVKRVAGECEIPVLQPERVRRAEELDGILALEPELIVVASFGQILPARLLDFPKCACLNLHPSLLPLYRGPSPIAGPILQGDKRTGTSLMLMAPRMDAGPVLAQVETEIGPEETAGELAMRLSGMSADLLVDRLPDWVDGKIEPVPQDEARATYTPLLTKENGQMDWQQPASQLARNVRAYNPWPGAFTGWEGRRLLVRRARVERGRAEPGQVLGVQDGGLAVGTGDGLLVLMEVQLAGGRPMSSAQLVSGYPRIVGARLGSE